MKHPMLATFLAGGLACVAGASAAQEETNVTNMQNITVTGSQAPYETYLINLHRDDYGLQAMVGNTRSQYMQARRAAERWERQRRQGAAPRPYVAVAIDNSYGPGVARQIQLIDSARNTVAIVNVYCKGVVPSAGNRCRFVRRPVATYTNGQRLASRLPATAAGLGG